MSLYHKTLATFAGVVLALLVVNLASAGDSADPKSDGKDPGRCASRCCNRCGCHHGHCHKVCRLVCEKKEIKATCWSSECSPTDCPTAAWLRASA